MASKVIDVEQITSATFRTGLLALDTAFDGGLPGGSALVLQGDQRSELTSLALQLCGTGQRQGYRPIVIDVLGVLCSDQTQPLEQRQFNLPAMGVTSLDIFPVFSLSDDGIIQHLAQKIKPRSLVVFDCTKKFIELMQLADPDVDIHIRLKKLLHAVLRLCIASDTTLIILDHSGCHGAVSTLKMDYLESTFFTCRIKCLKQDSHMSHMKLWINNAGKVSSGSLFYDQVSGFKNSNAMTIIHLAEEQGIILVRGKDRYILPADLAGNLPQQSVNGRHNLQGYLVRNKAVLDKLIARINWQSVGYSKPGIGDRAEVISRAA